jgi:hypothetical protein
MSNHHASLGPSGTHFAPPNRFGGRVQAQSELALPLNNGTWFLVEGAGTINRLPVSNTRTPVMLAFTAAATLVHSAALLLPGSANVTVAAGDTLEMLPMGDGVWRAISWDRASGKPAIGPAAADITDSTAAGRSFLTGNFPMTPQGRLTLSSGVPVMTSSVASAAGVYYTPYIGNVIPLYDGANFIATQFAEIAISLGSNWAANSNYDIFVALDAGTVRLCTGPAWTSDTGRGRERERPN